MLLNVWPNVGRVEDTLYTQGIYLFFPTIYSATDMESDLPVYKGQLYN